MAEQLIAYRIDQVWLITLLLGDFLNHLVNAVGEDRLDELDNVVGELEDGVLRSVVDGKIDRLGLKDFFMEQDLSHVRNAIADTFGNGLRRVAGEDHFVLGLRKEQLDDLWVQILHLINDQIVKSLLVRIPITLAAWV